MSKREGIVISVSGRYANLLTPYGEFVKVACNGKKPNVGEKFAGSEAVHFFSRFDARKIVAAACIMLALLIGGGVKAYYSPSATVLVNINPDIELKVNFLDRIISYKALNDDGSKVLSQIKIENANVNDGLKMIIDQSKKDKFIDKEYMKTKTISVDINGENINISKFKSNMETSDLNVKIQSNGNTILNKSLNRESNKSSKENSNNSSSKKDIKNADNAVNSRYLNSKSNYKTSNGSVTREKNNTYGGGNSSKVNNSAQNRYYEGKSKSDSKQLQRSSTNRIKENQNSIKNAGRKKNEERGYQNSSNRGSSPERNSRTRGNR
ncbi:anti-sigma factor domain-containing protein [Clostridium luticellarii]|jgi:hypothetical protein|uniref:Anti-sigma-I factor RsgI n=1 Tax=Clostridium luticellarii TaxID=1691940 RepID=A0A2T0B7H0_9CLOT|nr:anti-sigma factor domain-containing protein [Clostridium luticellarii]PRR79839.1 Anti-sigma-I factor RsgI [Clostridium luticellarii]